MAKRLGASRIHVRGDSKIVVGIVNSLIYPRAVKSSLFNDSLFDLLSTFDSVEFTHVPRNRNKVADTLANEAITFDQKPPEEEE